MHLGPTPTVTADQVRAALSATKPDAEPLVFTTRGNLPVSLLQYRYGWYENRREIVFVEEYLLGEESVKRSVHTMLKEGADSHAEAARLG